jgi:hypothetical protein
VDFEYSISHDDSLVNVITQGFFDYLKAYEMWKAIVATCDKSGCFQVLGETQRAAPIPLIDAYEHVALIESVGVTPDYRIAWVAKDPPVLERLRLIESILRDRSLFNVSIFESKADATRWLNASSQPRPGSRPHQTV